MTELDPGEWPLPLKEAARRAVAAHRALKEGTGSMDERDAAMRLLEHLTSDDGPIPRNLGEMADDLERRARGPLLDVLCPRWFANPPERCAKFGRNHKGPCLREKDIPHPKETAK